jgi:predicted MFS family arabinose efflux permease
VATEPAPRLFTRAFVALSLAELAYFTAAGIMIPVAPLFAAGPLGADDAGVGLAIGAFSASALVLRPYAGRLADRIGRRPLLLGGALAYAAIIAAHAAAPNLATLVVLRLLLGVAEAFFFVAGFAAVADLAPPNRTAEALSFNSLSLYLGVALGPGLGELLLETGGFTLAWLAAASLGLVAAALSLSIPETATRDNAAPPTPILHPAVIRPGLALAVGIATMAGFLAFVAIYSQRLGMDGYGGVLLLFGGIVIGLRVAFARLADRLPPLRVGAGAIGLCAAGIAVAGALQSPAGLYAGAALLATGVAFITPAFFAAIFASVRPAERGAASGTASAFLDLAFGGGPFLLGLAASAFGIPAAFGISAAVAAVGGLATARWARSVRASRAA